MDKSVKISVCMSIYKESLDYIKKSIDSIINQSFKDFEYIIAVDNPNIDNSIKLFLDKKNEEDERVKVLYNDANIGLASSLNKCIENSKGKYIARMDADDISFTNRLEKEYKFCEENAIDLLSTNVIYIDENDKIILNKKLISTNPQKTLPYYCSLFHPTIFINRKVINDINGYRNIMLCEDYEMYLRLLNYGGKIAILDEQLLYYRIRKSSNSHNNPYISWLTNNYVKKSYLVLKRNKYNTFSEYEFNGLFSNFDIIESKKFKIANDSTSFFNFKRNKLVFIFSLLHSLIKSPKWTLILAFEKIRNLIVTIYYNNKL